MRIIAAVNFNQGRAFVFDELPEFVFTKYKTCIIGRAGPFYEIYTYEAPTKYSKAFAGRKFTLTMHDGEEVHCEGQWWSGINAEVRTIIDIKSIGGVTSNSKLNAALFHQLKPTTMGNQTMTYQERKELEIGEFPYVDVDTLSEKCIDRQAEAIRLFHRYCKENVCIPDIDRYLLEHGYIEPKTKDDE